MIKENFDKLKNMENTENNLTTNSKKKKKRKNDTKELPSIEDKKKLKTDEKESITEENNLENGVDASDNEETSNVKISEEESSKFNGKFLRNSFNSSAGFSVLQKFVTICNQNGRDLAAEYLQAGGNVLEILRLLDSSEKKNINNASTVFSAMHIVIMKILAQFPQNQSTAEEACRHLINSHLASVHSMLSSQSKAKHRKIVLKLLAAVVSLGGTLPRELLNHLSLHSQLLEVLVSHSKPTDPESVRTCFIHFLLAFLVEGNVSDIRALLEKRGVLSSIFSGLIYDYSNIVQLVLTTVRKYVLENSHITKTTKLHVFSTPVVQEIVNLYNWKGPKCWPGLKKQKPLTEHIDPEQKKITVNAVHDFLLVLLTSNRHGIAFHDHSLGTDSGRAHNQLINTILKNLDKPWEHEKPSELIVKILRACPDLIKSQFLYTEPYLVPRATKNWVDVIKFIRKVIDDIDVESCLKLCSSDMTTLQMANAVLNLTLPGTVMKTAIIPSLELNNRLIHYEITKLLLVMIRKIERFIKVFEQIRANTLEISSFKNHMLGHVLKHLPSFESVLSIWNKAFSSINDTSLADSEDNNLNVEIKDHLLVILNLLQAYSEICPELLLIVNSTNSEIKPATLLTNLCNIKDIDESELIIMKVKALKILLYSSITEFSPNQDIFKTALSFLITTIGGANTSLDLEVRDTINLLLKGCDVFEGYNDQIEVWIDSIKYFGSFDEKLDIANSITKIIKRISKHTEKYITLIRKVEEDTEGEIISANRQENIFDELSERNIEDVKLLAPMLPPTSISLLLYAAVEDLKKNSSTAFRNYMSFVLIHLFHYQISTKAFMSVIENTDTSSHKYLLSWSNDDLPIAIKKPFNSNSIFRKISNALLENKSLEIYVAEKQLHIKLDDGVVKYTLTNFDVHALVRMVTFYLTQTLKKNNSEVENIAVYTNTLVSLLQLAKENCEDSLNYCTKWIFKHPILLQYFKGIYKTENAAEIMITTLIIKICNLFFNFKKQQLVTQFLHPYQEKFIMQIKSTVDKLKSHDSKEEFKAHVELIHLLQLNIKVTVDLISTIMNLSRAKFTLDNSLISIWGIIVSKLIDRFSTQEIRNEFDLFITLDEKLFKKIFTYLIELKSNKKINMDLWETSIYNYLLKFSHNISLINEKMFSSLLKSNITPTTEKLLNLFVERNFNFVATFTKYINANEVILSQKSLIFSTLSNNLESKWNQEFLMKVNKFYQKDIVLFLTEPQTTDFPWMQKNVKAVAYIIENSFDSKLCKEICDTILLNGNKLETISEGHVILFQNVFKKSVEVKPDAMQNFVQVLLHITVSALKKEAKNTTKLDFLCRILIDTINLLKIEELNKNNFWPQFTRIILKSGLKISKEDKKNLLLKALISTCDIAYRENCSEEYVKTIFEMTTSHSEFVNIMLSNSDVKSDLVELLWILVKKNHTVMLTTHIPLYLASYNATLSKSDQLILKILQHYENNKIKLVDYRPYLWGSAAASHYSVKGETDTALWRQPSTSQVLDLLIPEIVSNTIKNFPVKRNWKADEEATSSESVYDPAFYLPVFTHLLADNNVVACHKVIHSGALPLAIMACSSACEQIRLAAYTVISRFYFHLEATSSKEKLLWINFVDALRNGILNDEVPLEKVQLNGFVATFLARTSLVMTQPLNPLYSPLQAFLMAKPALDLNTIPEFFQLYHSSEIDHLAHRHWILEVIRDGLRLDSDMDVALKCFLFKMILDFYTSSLSDRKTKNLILQIVTSVTKLSKSCLILLRAYALLPWLLTATQQIIKGDIDLTKSILDIVNNILSFLQESKYKDTQQYLMLIKILLNLKSHFHQNINIECYQTFTQLLNKTIINSTICNAITKEHVKEIVLFSKHLLDDVSECEAMLQFGCKFFKRPSDELDDTLQESLSKFIVTWNNYFKKG